MVGDGYVDVIGHQMPLLNLAFPLPGHFVEHFPQMPTQLPRQRFGPILWNERDMAFVFPSSVTQAFTSDSSVFPFVRAFKRPTLGNTWTPEAATLWESPRPNGGLTKI